MLNNPLFFQPLFLRAVFIVDRLSCTLAWVVSYRDDILRTKDSLDAHQHRNNLCLIFFTSFSFCARTLKLEADLRGDCEVADIVRLGGRISGLYHFDLNCCVGACATVFRLH